MAAWGNEFYLLVLKVYNIYCVIDSQWVAALEDKIPNPRGHVISSIYTRMSASGRKET